MTTLIIYILFLHWVGDFICQTDWMAQNKSKSLEALLVHVFTYLIVLCSGVVLWGVIFWDWKSFPVLWPWVNSSIHFGVDAVTSRITAKLYAKNRHWFFVMIGLDQLIHTSILILTLPK